MEHLEPRPDATPIGAASGPDLARLLKLSARGDDRAFGDFYDATSARVYGLALRVLRDPAQAEEVAQEAYLEIWRTSSRYDESRGTALAWAMTIVHRRAVDRVRAAEAAVKRDLAYEQHHRSVEHDTTAEAAQSAWDARRVRSALATLTTVQREAVTLAYFGGYTHTEVATLLELPIGTAKSRIRDGLIRMRDRLGMGEDR